MFSLLPRHLPLSQPSLHLHFWFPIFGEPMHCQLYKKSPTLAGGALYLQSTDNLVINHFNTSTAVRTVPLDVVALSALAPAGKATVA